MSLVRAFLAIPLSGDLKTALQRLQSDLKARNSEVRWSRLDNLHLTLHFFGEIHQENLEKIMASMLSVSNRHKPFQVNVTGLGAFPNVRRPRVVWLGLTPQHPLRQLHQDCQTSLQAAGIVTDSRPYAPHLTIGRVRARTDLTALSREIGTREFGQLAVDRLVLYESRLRPGGAEHRPLFSVALGIDADEHQGNSILFSGQSCRKERN